MLERQDLNYSRSYIALLMKEMGFKSVLKRKFISTTDSKHSFPIAENILDRNLKSTKLGEKWVSDISYIRVNDDWNYLTIIMDLADRKIVGWSLSENMRAENTVCQAWINARKIRTIKKNFIFHSDRSVQYTSSKISALFSFHCKRMIQSMSIKGNCWDNAVAESFFKTIKHEWLYRFKYNIYSQLYDSVEKYMNWYNNQRLHSSLGYISPLEMEVIIRNNFKIAA
jgi:putative transposase